MKKVILFLVLLGVMMAVGLGAMVWVLGGTGTEVADGSVLCIGWDGDLRESEQRSPLAELTGGGGATLRDLLSGLDRAAHDERIAGVLLQLDGAGFNYAQAQELRAAVERYREATGKPVVSFAEALGNGSYYLASGSDRVVLVPAGEIDLRGLAMTSIFLRGTLDKLGVEAEFEHIGKYKSAAEMFTEEQMSEPARESLGAILDDLYEQLLEGIAEGRSMSVAEARRIVDEGPWQAGDALAAGLVDTLAYADEWGALFDFFEGRAEDDLPLVDLQDYLEAGLPEEPPLEERTVALIYGAGSIHSGSSEGGPFSRTESIGSETLVDAIREVRLDDDIDALVLRYDSPGGSALASDVIWREVALTKQVKPVVVSMGGVAASGGYYISCAATEIFVDPGTITGSVGVVGGKFNLAGLYEKLGVTHDTLRRGRHADLFADHRAWTEEERASVRHSMEVVYDTFVSKVAEGRGMERDAVLEIAQGRVWSGVAAIENGLADQVGGLWDALRRAKELVGVDPDHWVSLRVLPEEKPLLEQLLSGDLFGARAPAGLSAEAAALAALPAEARALLPLLEDSPLWRHWQLFATTEPGDPLTFLPYELELEP